METKFLKTGMTTAFSAILLPIAASASLVSDGDFSSPGAAAPFETFGVGQLGTSSWSVTAGSVDIINGYWQPAPGSSQSVDAAGNINGTISQTISGLTVGQNYLLSFFMAANPDGDPTIKTLDASLGTSSQIFTFDKTGHTRADMGWTLETVVFKADAASEALSFADQSFIPPGNLPSPFGAALDNVSLVAVPEANTVIASALLLLPFGASTLRILRKKQAV